MKKGFDQFLSQLLETNNTLGSFTNFEKARRNVNKIAIKLHQLNYLIGKDDLSLAIAELYQENPTVFEVLEILIAVRREKNVKTLNHHHDIVSLESYFHSVKGIELFIMETGLCDVFRNKDITNLVDYVFGIEVGLDTNARKNRSGTVMSSHVAALLDEAGIPYEPEVSNSRFPHITSFGVDIKKFDFVIETPIRTYLIEANFYNVGGSKLNEVARAYTEIARKLEQYQDYEFVWITDGQGWLSAKNKLEGAYSVIKHLYNLSTIATFIQRIQQEFHDTV